MKVINLAIFLFNSNERKTRRKQWSKSEINTFQIQFAINEKTKAGTYKYNELK